MKPQKALQELRTRLEAHNIKIRSVQEAITTNSIYVKFEDERLKSLTVRDHRGKVKYRYKWNLFKNWTGPNEQMDRGVRRFYYGFDAIDQLANRIVRYRNSCDSNIL